MNIDRWDPIREVGHLLAGHFAPPRTVNDGAWLPPTDIREEADAYRLDVELPAVAAADVRVELRDGVLHVAGERPAPAVLDGRAFRREQRYGKFARSFRMPEDADPEAVSATAKDGIVSIVVHKSKEARARSIEVRAA